LKKSLRFATILAEKIERGGGFKNILWEYGFYQQHRDLKKSLSGWQLDVMGTGFIII